MQTHMLRFGLALAVATVVAISAGSPVAHAQGVHLERLPAEILKAAAPADRVAGEPGEMRVTASSCQNLPLATARRRIVDVAVQEWAYFGFSVTDRTQQRDNSSRSAGPTAGGSIAQRWRGQDYRRLRAEEFERLAPSIAGYWAATAGGAWALERQNDVWNRSSTIGSRWRDPWSAAFISWLMCESGLGVTTQFQRSIAHWAYVDQAIRARDGTAPGAAFVAHDVGETKVIPGDLLCSGTGYRTIGQRRGQMGRAARMHCDVVVAVDEPTNSAAGLILAIGGNVRGTVSLKRLPAVRDRGDHLHPRDDIFAHLTLRSAAIGASALTSSPTVRALASAEGFAPPRQIDVLNLPLRETACRICPAADTDRR